MYIKESLAQCFGFWSIEDLFIRKEIEKGLQTSSGWGWSVSLYYWLYLDYYHTHTQAVYINEWSCLVTHSKGQQLFIKIRLNRNSWGIFFVALSDFVHEPSRSDVEQVKTKTEFRCKKKKNQNVEGRNYFCFRVDGRLPRSWPARKKKKTRLNVVAFVGRKENHNKRTQRERERASAFS